MKRFFQIVVRVAKLLLLLMLSPLIIVMPRNRKKMLFGAWHGKQYSCNPKYLFEYMVQKGGFDCIWVGESHLRNRVLQCPGAKFVERGSLMALWHVLTASFYFCNINWRGDIANVPRCRRVELFYLTHGYADKNVGIKQYNGKGVQERCRAPLQLLRNVLNRIEDILYGYKSWCSESSEQGISIRLSNQPFIMSPDRMLKFGKPRADYFLKNKHNDEEKRIQKAKIASVLGLPFDKKWYVYVPTWRHGTANAFSFSQIQERALFDELLEFQNAIIIEKQHPLVLRDIKLPFGQHGQVYVLSPDQSREIDTQELLMASDRLITDYSSVYYDFVLLNRPVIHFVYDYDDFMTRDMGFNYDMRKYGGGSFVYTFDELIDTMKLSDEELLARRNAATIKEQLTFENGSACSHYYQFTSERMRERGFFVR